MTLLMWNNTLYLHPRTNPNRLMGDLRNEAGKPRPGMASVAHPEFVHGLHVSLDAVTRTLGLQRLPDVEFNLLTMVRSLLPSPILWLVLGSPTLVVTPALADHDAPAADGALRGGGGDAARAVGQRQLLQQDGAYA